MRRFAELVLATLREIFDEAAYERFLARQGAVASRESYAEFADERKPKVKCC